uniref:Uncharacterized protein n=1 Tax=Ascaris lumbricoides TaxID=6252 RepID=A0A0M3HIV2_ASCLU
MLGTRFAHVLMKFKRRYVNDSRESVVQSKSLCIMCRI